MNNIEVGVQVQNNELTLWGVVGDVYTSTTGRQVAQVNRASDGALLDFAFVNELTFVDPRSEDAQWADLADRLELTTNQRRLRTDVGQLVEWIGSADHPEDEVAQVVQHTAQRVAQHYNLIDINGWTLTARTAATLGEWLETIQ